MDHNYIVTTTLANADAANQAAFASGAGHQRFEVRGTKKHQWKGVNSCADRTAQELQIALDAWKVEVSAAYPNDSLIGAIYLTPVQINYRQHSNFGKRKCRATAYMTLVAEFERGNGLRQAA
nr:hypothetical protein [uncultured Caldimonas sp.]